MNKINQSVAITAMYFQNKKQLQEYPKKMEWGGESYTFNSGLVCTVQTSDNMFRIYQMSDGRTDYRLKFDAALRSWTLLGMSI